MKSTPTRVLIIDDDPLIRTLLVSALKKECLVAVASEGSEGFYKALELTPDVAVIDVNMPGWDGLKTLNAFRAHPTLAGVKVIMLTADASKQTVMASIRGGASDYLIKTNFSKADFYRKLNRLVPGTIAELAPKGAARTLKAEASAVALGIGAPADAVAATSNTAPADHRLQEMIDGWE